MSKEQNTDRNVNIIVTALGEELVIRHQGRLIGLNGTFLLE